MQIIQNFLQLRLDKINLNVYHSRRHIQYKVILVQHIIQPIHIYATTVQIQFKSIKIVEFNIKIYNILNIN